MHNTKTEIIGWASVELLLLHETVRFYCIISAVGENKKKSSWTTKWLSFSALTEMPFLARPVAIYAADLVILQAIHFPILGRESGPTLDLLLSFYHLLAFSDKEKKKNNPISQRQRQSVILTQCKKKKYAQFYKHAGSKQNYTDKNAVIDEFRSMCSRNRR